MSGVYILNILNLLSVNGAPDGSRDENKVNMILNALSIRNVGAQIWRRVAPVKALCLQLSRDTRAVISDARETLAEAHDDPGGLACLGEQMCHPLATVVPYPQWPCGRRWASCGLKMIPHLTSSRVGCREGASRGGRGRGREKQGGCEQHTYLQDQYLPKILLGSQHLLHLCIKSRSCWNEFGWSLLKISLTSPPIWTWKLDRVIIALKSTADFSLRLFFFSPSDSSLKQIKLIMNILKAHSTD